MQIQIVVRRINQAPGDIGAVVGGALQIGQKIGKHKTRLHTAPSLLHPQNMSGAQLFLQLVNHLLQGLHIHGCFQIPLPEGVKGHIQYFGNSAGKHLEFFYSLFAERSLFLS